MNCSLLIQIYLAKPLTRTVQSWSTSHLFLTGWMNLLIFGLDGSNTLDSGHTQKVGHRLLVYKVTDRF